MKSRNRKPISRKGRPTRKRRRTSRPNPLSVDYQTLEKRQLLATLSAGEPDPRFGDGGLETVRITSEFAARDTAVASAVQPDGKLVVGTQTHVLRYNADGGLDLTFGENGMTQLTVFDIKNDGLGAIKVLPNGKILASGIEKFSRNIVVAQLHSDGSIDTSFGENGFARQEVVGSQPGFETSVVTSGLVRATDGRLFVTASINLYQNNSNYKFTVSAFQPNGDRDASFGDNGLLTLDDYYSEGDGNRVVLQSDGTIIALAANATDDFYQHGVLRIQANGELDSTFGDAGHAAIGIGSTSLQQLGDGKILVSGWKYDSVRLNSDGSVDETYGDEGYSSHGFGYGTEASILLPNGQLQIVGSVEEGSEGTDLAVVRVNSDGSLDTSFGNNGMLVVDTGENERAYGVSIDASGTSYSVGRWDNYDRNSSESDSHDALIVKITASGVLDSTFDDDGVVVTDIVGTYDVAGSAQSVRVLPNGKFLVLGNVYQVNVSNIVLRQYNADGSLDTGYGDQGVAIIDVGQTVNYGGDFSIQPDGKAVIVASVNVNDDSAFGIFRVNTDGSLDSSFGTDGLSVLAADGNIYPSAVTVTGDANIVVGGYGYTADGRYILTQLDSSGALDTSFGMKFFAGFSGTINDLAMQGTSIIATGGGNGDTATTLRFNADGTRDFSFGIGGKAQTQLTFFHERGSEVLVQPDNKIVIVGQDRNTGNDNWAVERYNADGTRDSSFGSNGIVRIDLGESYEDVNAVDIQPDGKLVVVGHSNTQVRAVRLNTNGTMDSGFGENGVASVSFDSLRSNERANSVAVLPSGGIIVVGQLDPGWSVVNLLGATTHLAPVAVNDQFSTLETDSVNGDLFTDNGFGEDFDYTDDPFSVVRVNGVPISSGAPINLASGASLIVNSDGTFNYDPNGQFDSLGDGDFGTDSFVYQLTTGTDLSNAANVTIQIVGLDLLDAVNDVFVSAANARVTDDVSANDSSSPTATYHLLSQPSNGVLQMDSNGVFNYRPTDGFIGSVTFDYEVVDGEESDTATVELLIGNQALVDDLVAYWNFDDPIEGLNDLSPFDQIDDNGVAFSDPVFSNHGFLNGGVELDGVSDAIHIPSSTEINDLSLTQRSISVWFQANELPTDGTKQVIYEEGAQSGFNIYLQDGVLYMGAWRNHGRGFATFVNSAAGDVEVGRWHHATLVLDAPELGDGTLKGFLDGTQFDQAIAERVTTHAAGIGIGAMNAGTAFHDIGRINRNGFNLNGSIDEVRIYNRALSPSEIDQLTPANLVDDLTVHWTADGPAGTDLVDASPDGQNNSAELFGVQRVQGQNGGGLYFDGTAYVDVENSEDINLAQIQQRTISLNFKPDDLAGRQVLYKQGFNSGFNIYLEDGDLVVGGYRNAGRGWQQFFRTSNIEAGKWHQVTLTLQSTAIRRGTFSAFLDGQEFGSGIAGNINLNLSSIGLGRLRGGAIFQYSGAVTTEDYFYQGMMDDIRMYDRALTSDEVEGLYQRR